MWISSHYSHAPPVAILRPDSSPVFFSISCMYFAQGLSVLSEPHDVNLSTWPGRKLGCTGWIGTGFSVPFRVAVVRTRLLAGANVTPLASESHAANTLCLAIATRYRQLATISHKTGTAPRTNRDSQRLEPKLVWIRFLSWIAHYQVPGT